MLELSLHILDVVENSLRAGAGRVSIGLEASRAANRLDLVVEDNGRGMPPDLAARAADPFFTSRRTRKVGLGLALLRQAAEACEGLFELRSQPGRGTVVRASFGLTHLDRPPVGDMAATLLGLIVGRPEADFSYSQRVDGLLFELDSADIKRRLAGAPLSDGRVVEFLKEYLAQGCADLAGL